MGMPEPNPLDDEFARLLAAHDERLLTGKSQPSEEISHPNIIPIHEAGAAGSVCYIV